MIVGVHHRRVPDFLAQRTADFPGEAFAGVADVHVRADEEIAVLNTAYRLTQHCDSSWTDGDQVCRVTARDVRSTSVGDVLTIGERAYAVLPVGFKRLH